MTAALAATANLPDLLGTSPADLIDQADRTDSTLAEATARAERLRAGIVRYAEMRQDIADAYACRDWLALDYGSWYEYVDGEFGEQLAQLARGDRQQAVSDLRSQGMSTRQIASATGIDARTVRRDLDQVGHSAPPDAKVTGADGKSYASSRPTPKTPGPVEADAAPSAVPGSTPEPVDVPDASTVAAGSGPDLAQQVWDVLDRFGNRPFGLTIPEIWVKLPGGVHSSAVSVALAELAAAGRAHVMGTAEGKAPIEQRQRWLNRRPIETSGPVEPPSTAPGPEPAPAADVPPSREPDPTPPPGSPAAWTPEERAANQREIDRKRMIAAGRSAARNLVMSVQAEIGTVLSAIDLGEKDLINAEMIAKLRRAVDLLESRLEASK